MEADDVILEETQNLMLEQLRRQKNDTYLRAKIDERVVRIKGMNENEPGRLEPDARRQEEKESHNRK